MNKAISILGVSVLTMATLTLNACDSKSSSSKLGSPSTATDMVISNTLSVGGKSTFNDSASFNHSDGNGNTDTTNVTGGNITTNNINASAGTITGGNVTTSGTLTGAKLQLTQSSLSQTYSVWTSKNSSNTTPMIKTRDGFCFLTKVVGAYEGNGEYVQIYQALNSDDNNEEYWYLKAAAGDAVNNQSVGAEAMCFLYTRA